MNNIKINKLKFVYDNLGSSLYVLLFLSSIVMFTLYGVVEKVEITLWYTISLFLVFIRWYSLRLYKKEAIDEKNYKKLYNIYLILVVTYSLLWGLGISIIMPTQIEYQLFLVLIIAGLASGSTVTNSSIIEFVYIYSILLFVPLIMYFLLSDQLLSYSIAASISLYFIFLLSAGKIISTIIVENITFRLENENLIEQLRDEAIKANSANEAKSQFLSVMSHEIRTPLNAIIGFIKVLLKMENDPKKLKYLNTVDKSSLLLQNIINDILDVSKIESGKLELEFLQFEVASELKQFYELFLEVANAKNINLIYNSIGNMPSKIISDKLRLKQIVSNLLSNAIKFTPEGKKVALNVSFDERMRELKVEVQDEGVGIAQENIKKITQSFTQADSSVSREYGGTGLGLSIVTKLLNLFHSELVISSVVGEGSSFSFTIKVDIVEGEKENQSELKERSEALDFKGKKVLVAEDNKTNQMLIRLLLEDVNIDVDIADDGEIAVEMYKNANYELLLMDINMPNKNGIEAMHEIRSLDPTAKIIALTANSVTGDREKFLAEGFDNYLAKPIDHDALEEMLTYYLV